ncbi:unnamed protein product [Ilex paraguariensis]|uniref:Endonuclease/exonuclease/phosphatase domain-containing protein n=1 Tax=Ilex paraguariensis TaxID=185542 RepID=A0ABC8U7R8_9AQUA
MSPPDSKSNELLVKLDKAQQRRKKRDAEIATAQAALGKIQIPSTSRSSVHVKANTHVNVQHDLKDVKLWQVHTLLKGLEKIAASADIPMLVCGDFNAVPGSAPHALLALGKVDPMNTDLAVDPLGILRPSSKLVHQLPLVSAYSSFARIGVGLSLEQQRRRMDPATNEPLFTNCTRDFIGTHDYIFYSALLTDGGEMKKRKKLDNRESSCNEKIFMDKDAKKRIGILCLM